MTLSPSKLHAVRRASHSGLSSPITTRSFRDPSGSAVGLAQHALAGEAELPVGALGAGVVGEAVEPEAMRFEGAEGLVEQEAQERDAEPAARARGDRRA